MTTTTTTAIAPPRSFGYTLPNARVTSFEERITRNPRPAKLTVEMLIERALVQRGTIARIYKRYLTMGKTGHGQSGGHVPAMGNGRLGKRTSQPTPDAHSVDATEIAIDVVARIVEVAAHLRYNPTLASVDSFIVGFARMWFRKQIEVRGRRDRILREGVAKQPTRAVGTFADAAVQQEQSTESMAAIRAKLTPMEARLLDLLVRTGKFDADQAAAALGTDPVYARTLMAGVRRAARFIGFHDGARRPSGRRTA